jgi:hypothetical protein
VIPRTLEAEGGVLLSETISRPKSPPRIVDDPLLIGFDTEYRPHDGALLSVQFSARGTQGELESRIYYPEQPKLSVEQFGVFLFAFIADLQLREPKKRRVYLVAHFAQAELAGFENPLRDWNITEAGKAHGGRLELVGPGDKKWLVRLIDLFGYFPMSLAVIGDSVGLPKLEVDVLHVEELLQHNRDTFEAYAKRDAEIALVAFEKFRSQILSEFGIEVLVRPTLASVASDIFRRHFLKSYPAPVKTVEVTENRRRADGYRRVSRRVEKFNGSWDIRYLACRAYWGGRTEAFIRGLYHGPVVMRDVISLYPHAALLQPLPTEKTKWEPVSSIVDVKVMEGVGQFTFEFPADVQYPCLPVTRETVTKLSFPRKGETYCTFAEVRAALDMRARVEPVRAWGFRPTAREREHDVGRYMRAFIEKKKDAQKGSLEYETAKLLLNALVGKFGERRHGSTIVPFERQARAQGVPGVVALFAKSPLTRDALQRGVQTGSAWAPEWATLILGRARALMAPMIAKGALFVSTDAVLVPAGTSLDVQALRDLEGIGSGLVDEAVGDAAFVARSRLYAILQRPQNLMLGQAILAQNEDWAVVKVARHASPETKPEFAQTVLACLAAGKDMTKPVGKKRLLGARQAILHDKALNEEVVEDRRTNLRWDGKRAPQDRDVNPFTSYTETIPYTTIGKLDAADHQRQVHVGEARRVRKARAKGTMLQVIDMLTAGASVREIEAATGIPRSTVYDMKKKFGLVDREAS